jgi:hypothetical protein
MGKVERQICDDLPISADENPFFDCSNAPCLVFKQKKSTNLRNYNLAGAVNTKLAGKDVHHPIQMVPYVLIHLQRSSGYSILDGFHPILVATHRKNHLNSSVIIQHPTSKASKII